MKPVVSSKTLAELLRGEEVSDPRQLLDIVRKLQVVVADYLESGVHLGIRLQPVEILSAIDAARHEARGEPSPWPDGADARTFFVHGLYQELVQQPSNIFETRVFPDGTERFLPLHRGLWTVCLDLLRDSIERGTRKHGGGRSSKPGIRAGGKGRNRPN